MAAEIGEEVGVERQRLAAEDALGRDEQRGFRFVARLLLLARRIAGGERDGAQGLAVDLAGGQARQRLHDLEVARNHVGRQLLAQVRAQGRAVERGPALRHQEGDEAVDARHPGAAPRPPGRCPANRRDLRLDLAELDAEAADLDLVVDAAVEDDVAVARRGSPRRPSDRGSDRGRRSGTGC